MRNYRLGRYFLDVLRDKTALEQAGEFFYKWYNLKTFVTKVFLMKFEEWQTRAESMRVPQDHEGQRVISNAVLSNI